MIQTSSTLDPPRSTKIPPRYARVKQQKQITPQTSTRRILLSRAFLSVNTFLDRSCCDRGCGQLKRLVVIILVAAAPARILVVCCKRTALPLCNSTLTRQRVERPSIFIPILPSIHTCYIIAHSLNPHIFISSPNPLFLARFPRRYSLASH